MKALQFLKIDLIRSRQQIKVLGLFVVLAFFLSKGNIAENSLGVMYMAFAAIIVSAQPFAIEQTSDSGFISLLPGTKRDRVMGRFLFSLMTLLLALLAGGAILVVLSPLNFAALQSSGSLFAGIAAASLIACALQNILLYAMGKGKSQLVMVFACMIPGFLTFLLSTTVIEKLQDPLFASRLSWVISHANEISVGALGIAVIVFAAAVFASTALIKNRDFN